MPDLHELTAAEAGRRIRAGTLSPADLLDACLARIAALEPSVKAWVHLDRDGARRAAAARTAEAAEGRWRGPFHGVPVALKDIYDAAGLVTTAGAPAFAHRRADADASSVARLRAAGAVIAGKLTSTPFAFLDPTLTTNPWNPAHTPGGSSSGSAAAVAARMVPLALGSQTLGSVLRPAAYCGVVGFKPTHGRISTAGVLPLCWSTDHVGILSRGVEDVALALGALAGHDPADPLSVAAPVDDYAGAIALPPAPRIGVLRALVDRATPELTLHLESVIAALRGAGASVVDVALPASFAEIHDAGNTVVRAEAAAYHRPMFARHAAEYPPGIRGALEQGREISAIDYLAAQATRRRFRADMAGPAAHYDGLLSPVAPGPAPKGLGATGDPYFCAPWSFAGMPSISLPSGLAGDGLPLAVQLTGAAWSEARLLAAARWCERCLGFKEMPRA